ncbi:hypothetical protein D8674_032509 [Pyrus ussuriensis x Pyrus communis]|uniref:Uncharacterized protein n=1 Tax=Pyrus ussuriensis x Pyrus communis TaxID=2448454 RepID=A0A5N5HWG6_9ROSA|nr:hypothetical protein D8674_032509 [Pyrus ussuriensis x Pyrus communis]
MAGLPGTVPPPNQTGKRRKRGKQQQQMEATSVGFRFGLGLFRGESASEKSFPSLPDMSKAIFELTVLNGVGPATATAVVAAYAPEVAPFMSDEDLSIEGETFTPSDVERALWSCAVGAKLSSQKVPDPKSDTSKNSKRKRKR